MKLLLLFIGVPVLEMWLLIRVGSAIGALPTISLVILTALIGFALLRQQGLYTLLRAHRRIELGEIPATEIAEGLALAIGGALLLTPGFITDTFGFLCLLPISRRWLIRRLSKQVRIVPNVDLNSVSGQTEAKGSGETIEGEYSRVERTD